jgi:TnsA endonuclease N terminal
MRARRVIRRGTRRTVGKFPTLKPSKRSVHWESLLERDYYYLLEIDSDVISYREQPLKIEYILDGKKHRYTPDLLVERRCKRQIIEVKLEEKVKKYDLLFRIASEICARNGYEFVVVTDETIRVQPRLNNVKVLWRYSRTQIRPQHQITCQELLTIKSEVALGKIIELLGNGGAGTRVAYALLYWGVLSVDLMKPINKDSLVCLPCSIS